MEEPVHVNRGLKSTKLSWFSLENVSLIVVSGLLFLLPLFFIPIVGVSVQFSKFLLVTIAVLVVGGIWVLQRLKDGVFELPINMLSLSSLAVLGVLVLSAVFSGTIQHAFIGQGFETDTVLFFGFAFLIMLLIPGIFTTKRAMINAYTLFFGCLIVLGFVHLFRLAFPTWLSFGVLMYPTDTLLGKWNDLAIFFGFGALLSLITLESLPLNKIFRIVTSVVLVASLFFLAIINFSLIWYILGALSLIFFVYGVVMGRLHQKGTAKITLPVASCVVLIISVIFIFAGSHIGDALASKLNVSHGEVRPTWQGTMDIARQAIVQKSVIKPLFGVGPNNFEQAWLMYKPSSVNNTLFWNTSFNYGVGIIPSMLVTTGVLGFLSWVAFLGVLVYMGFRSILSKIPDATVQYLVVSSFIGALYLWLFSIIYVPSLAVLVITFIFTGLFISSLTIAGILNPVKIEYFKNPKIGFASVFILIILLIVGIGVGYVSITRLAAVHNYQKAIQFVNEGKFTEAEGSLVRALRYSENDVYYRALAQTYVLHINNLVANAQNTSVTEGLEGQLRNLATSAIQAANSAVAYNDTNYRNYSVRGDIFSALVPYGFTGAYESAVADYNQVLKFNPQSPTVYLQLARAETAQSNVPQAKNYIEQAVKMKYNYTDAYYFLAQIQIAQGETEDAINSVLAAALSEQTNPGLFYQLGLLYYSEKDYKNAATAFEKAISINTVYSNARYYLGLTYYELDQITQAIAQFEEVLRFNPDSQDVQKIISNLKSGRAPFAGATTPVAASSEEVEEE